MVSLAVPAGLAAIALIDGVLAGYRAATGRNGRIRKREYYLLALRRGLLASVVVLLVLAVVLLAAVPAREAELVRAGTAMLWVIGPYALLVIATMVGYRILPRRDATFLVLLGLGPLTLIRPWIAIGGGLAATVAVPDPVVAGCAVVAVAGVLAVEPWVHRRWYFEPI